MCCVVIKTYFFVKEQILNGAMLRCVCSYQAGRLHARALRPEVEYGREVHRAEETAE